MQPIKQPDDFVIRLDEVKFTRNGFPREALFWGYTVDLGGAEKNNNILSRLKSIHDGAPPDEILMEGRLSGREREMNSREYELQETPFAPFALNFEMSMHRLTQKYLRYNVLRKHDDSPQNIDLFTYRDSILVDVAAICTENEKRENYTIKVFLRRQKHNDLYAPIGEILDRKICVDCDKAEITVANAIKILRDKFICHFDNFEDYDMTGRDGLSDGKWTPGDRIVLSELLLPTDRIGPIDEITVLLNNIVENSSSRGQRELLDTLWDNLNHRIDVGSSQ